MNVYLAESTDQKSGVLPQYRLTSFVCIAATLEVAQVACQAADEWLDTGCVLQWEKVNQAWVANSPKRQYMIYEHKVVEE